MKFGIVVFPGSNCDHDAYHATKHVLGQPSVYLWHKSEDLQGVDVVILPGGFSFGDYLRTGAIARFSPIMKKVVDFANGGGLVLGICNGFQILLECSLLPGAMLRNKGLKFICAQQHIRVETTDSPFTATCAQGEVLSVPIAHHDGNYYADPETLARLKEENRILFRYCDADGHARAEANPNGSLDNIAGICNAGRNVVGMMPHHERACEAVTGSADGMKIFQSLFR